MFAHKWTYLIMMKIQFVLTFTAPKHPKKATMETIAATTMMM